MQYEDLEDIKEIIKSTPPLEIEKPTGKQRTCGYNGCKTTINEDDWFCEEHHWEGVAEMFPEDCCPDCSNYTHDGSWCEDCLDDVDLDEHEERKRRRLAEAQEY